MTCVAVFMLVAGVAAGCATPTSSADTSPAATTAPEESVSDAVACETFGDVLTIVHNTEVAASDGRMGELEQAGWYRLATRVQDHIGSPDSGPVADALAAVKKAAPPVAPGAKSTPGVLTEEWTSARDDLLEACKDAGSPIAAEGFVGG